MLTSIRRLLAVALCAPAAIIAQTPSRPADSNEPVPRELVMALLNLGPGMRGSADLRVGRAPDDAPPELIPPGFEILGSTIQFESMILVLAGKLPPDSAVGFIESKLLAGGWTKPPMPNYRPMRGFVSADIGNGPYGPPDILCNGDAFVTMSSTYRRNAGSIVKLSYNRGQQYSACKVRSNVEVSAMMRDPYNEAPVPILRAPAGSIMAGNGGGGMSMNTNSITMTTRLKTKLKPAEVSTHYDKQMREQGWTPLADGAVDMFAARRYSKTDDKKKSWTAMLVAMNSADPGDQDAMLVLASKP